MKKIECDRCGSMVSNNSRTLKDHYLTASCIRKMFERNMPGLKAAVTVLRIGDERVRVSVKMERK